MTTHFQACLATESGGRPTGGGGTPGTFLGCAVGVYREAGVRGFYRGLFPAILRAFPANGANFLGYELVRGLLEEAKL